MVKRRTVEEKRRYAEKNSSNNNNMDSNNTPISQDVLDYIKGNYNVYIKLEFK